MKIRSIGLGLCVASSLCSGAFAATFTVNQFDAPVAPGTEVLNKWYSSDIVGAGTASIVSLSGVGGNLETAQPLPTGAALLTTGSVNTDKAVVTTYADFGLASSVLPSVELLYSYFKSTNLELAAAPAIKLTLFSAGGSGDNFGTLIYEPYWNGANPPQNSWQSVSINSSTGSGGDGTGGWWWNGGFEIGSGAGGPPLRSLSEWNTAFSGADATDYASAHVVGLSIGVGSFNVNQTDYFDAVTIRTGQIDRTYNFEPTATVPDAGSTLMLCGMGALTLLGFRRRR